MRKITFILGVLSFFVFTPKSFGCITYPTIDIKDHTDCFIEFNEDYNNKEYVVTKITDKSGSCHFNDNDIKILSDFVSQGYSVIEQSNDEYQKLLEEIKVSVENNCSPYDDLVHLDRWTGLIGNNCFFDGTECECHLVDCEPQAQPKIFNDIDTNHKNAEAIKYLKDEKIFEGYTDGEFKGSNAINRAELIKILVEAKGEDIGDYSDCFPDVKNEWYAKYVCFAKTKNWVNGYDDGTYKPNNMVNKVEAIKMVVKIFEDNLLDQASFKLPFSDTNDSMWYTKYLSYALDKNLLELITGEYKPDISITRAEIAETLARLILTKINNADKFENSFYKNINLKSSGIKIDISSPPVCIEYGDERHGWYIDNTLIKYDPRCNKEDISECSYIDTFNEGWYTNRINSLIEYAICSEIEPPICLNDGIDTPGWYRDNELIKPDPFCEHKSEAECDNVETKSEGYYLPLIDDVIEYTQCNPPIIYEPPVCKEEPIKGWYKNSELIKPDLFCKEGYKAECKFNNSFSEGWYPPREITLIEYSECSINDVIPPICLQNFDEDKAKGWYRGDELIKHDPNCYDQEESVCEFTGTRSEGFYIPYISTNIEYTDCNNED